MPSWFHTAAIAVHRVGFRQQARRELARLSRHGGVLENQLADALEVALYTQATEEEADWMRRIEDLRTTLHTSSETVAFVDYGVPSRLKPTSAETDLSVSRAVSAVCRASAPAHEARVLFHLLRTFAPERCLELGTCLGISAAYQAAALTLNGSGRLVSLEGGAALAAKASDHLADLGLTNTDIVSGRFQDTLPEVLPTLAPIDYAFIDGHHDPAATQAYVQQLLPHLADRALLILDDIAWTSGMRRAWKAIIQNTHITTTVDLLTFGVAYFNRL